MILIGEDQAYVAAMLKRRFVEHGVEDKCVGVVSYVEEGGGERPLHDVAEEFITKLESSRTDGAQRTALVIDLAPSQTSTTADVEWGLRVVDRIAALSARWRSVSELLADEEFLVVLHSGFRLGSENIERVWKLLVNEIDYREGKARWRGCDIPSTRTKPLVYKTNKIADDGWIIPVIVKWLSGGE